MASGAELPWPDEPVLCQGCERWVGRGGAVPYTPQGEVDAGPDGAEVRLRLDGLASLVRDLGIGTEVKVAA